MNQEESTWWLLGLPIDCMTMEQAKARIVEAARTQTRLVFATPNVNFLALARRNVAFREAILRTDLSLVDGMPLVWMARMLGIPVPERVAGSNLMESLLEDDRTPPLRVFFFGGAPGIAQTACSRLNEAKGGLEAVGWHDPGFVDIEQMSDAETIEKVNSSGADILVLALGAEKGHLWIERNRNLLTVPVISHLGAVVNFLAQTVRRAPPGFQKAGLEWLWRISQEPALAKRYAKDALFLFNTLVTEIFPIVISGRSFRRDNSLRLGTSHLENKCAVIRLAGALTTATLPQLRNELGELSLAMDEVHLDFEKITTLDARAVGFLYFLAYRTYLMRSPSRSDKKLVENHLAKRQNAHFMYRLRLILRNGVRP